jgi:hypothetical protein
VGSNTAKGDGFLRVIKICRTPSFRGEVKPSAPCRKILQHIKEPLKNTKEMFCRLNSSFRLPVPPALLLDDSAGIVRELCWKNQAFSPTDIEHLY